MAELRLNQVTETVLDTNHSMFYYNAMAELRLESHGLRQNRLQKQLIILCFIFQGGGM